MDEVLVAVLTYLGLVAFTLVVVAWLARRPTTDHLPTAALVLAVLSGVGFVFLLAWYRSHHTGRDIGPPP